MKTAQPVEVQTVRVVQEVIIVLVYSLIWHHRFNRTTVFAVCFVGIRTCIVNESLHLIY
jgi:threonine/homoserine efflux transporter RhtA